MRGFKTANRINKKFEIVFLLIAIACFNSSFTKTEFKEILNSEDFDEVLKQHAPALTCDDGFQSYKEWRCFSSQEIQLSCSSRADSDSAGDNPDDAAIMMTADGNSKQIEFVYEFDEENCSQKLNAIKKLLANQEEVCVLGAYLQQMFENDPSEFWIMYKLKTNLGSWPSNDANQVSEED